MMHDVGTLQLTKLVNKLATIFNSPQQIELDGESTLSLSDVYTVANFNSPVLLTPNPSVLQRIKAVRSAMLEQIESGVPIYGVSSAYGGQAGRVLNEGGTTDRYKKAKQISQAIVHVDVSTGPEIPINIVRAAMLLRVNMLLPGYSSIRLELLETIAQLLNKGITPVVGFYGTLGASGDLAHNGRLASVLLHDPSAYVRTKNGEKTFASKALKANGIPKIDLEPKEGLALVNGDNFSSAAAVIQTLDAIQLMLVNLGSAAMMIQALQGSNRNFHPLLADVRPHEGQRFVADSLRKLLHQSQLVVDELNGPKRRKKHTIIQDSYSIRCLPQYLGPDWETLDSIWETIATNCNSVSDNPIWTTPETVLPGEKPYQWVSGGNFLAMYMADALDKLRKVLVHIVKQNDRHLARLINPHQNNNLPANLSDPAAISQCTFKGLQTQMGMYDVYATVLATPVSTAFGVHEEANQDLTSHAMTSALLNQEVLKLTRLSLATNLIASCQAVDLRGGPDQLSPTTEPIYKWIRARVPYVKKEQPLGQYVEAVAAELLDQKLISSLIAGITP